jgi:hypothetical protein
MMVRDSADDTLASDFQLDKEFGDKFTGELKNWAKYQGISDDLMKYIWRAHWQIPSPTQLYEMYHRLRSGDDPSGQTVDIDQIKAALAQQDIAPFWRDKLIAISFAPLTRVDVRRGFEIGALDKEAVTRSYRNRGYDEVNSQILTDFTYRQLVEKLRRSPQVGQFSKGEMVKDDLIKYLDRFPLEAEDRQDIVLEGFRRMKSAQRKACTKSVRTKYMTGSLTSAEAKGELVGIGQDTEFADSQVEGWACELASKSKPVQAAKLCNWYERGLITAPDYISRLVTIGWKTEDAVKFVTECQMKIGDKFTKNQESMLRRQQAQIEKEQRRKEREAKQLAGAVNAAEKAAQAAQNAQGRRDQMLVKYAKIWADRWGLDITDSFVRLRSAMQKTRANWVLTPDQGIRSVVLAVEKEPTDGSITIEERIDEVGESFAIAES